MGAGHSREDKDDKAQPDAAAAAHSPRDSARSPRGGARNPGNAVGADGAAGKTAPRYVDFTPGTDVSSKKGKKEHTVPTVFRWAHGGRKVYLAGSFNSWKERIPMSRSGEDFIAILNIPPGKHEFKFVVDDEWRTDPNAQSEIDALGNVNNILEVTEQPRLQDTDDTGTTPIGPSALSGYSTQEKGFTEDKKNPPLLPPHLRYTPLNSARKEGVDPLLLPVPLHVTLNHVYLSHQQENVIQLGITHRYKSKYSTALLYKPAVQNDNLSSNSTDSDVEVQAVLSGPRSPDVMATEEMVV